MADIKRRFATRYYTDESRRHRQLLAHGAANQVATALRAGVYAVFTRKYGSNIVCVVFDRELEIELMVVRMDHNGIGAKFSEEVKRVLGYPAKTPVSRLKLVVNE